MLQCWDLDPEHPECFAQLLGHAGQNLRGASTADTSRGACRSSGGCQSTSRGELAYFGVGGQYITVPVRTARGCSNAVCSVDAEMYMWV